MTTVETLLNDPDTAGVWNLVPDRSTITFKIKNMWGLINVKGRFTDFNADGQITEVRRSCGATVESWVYEYGTVEDASGNYYKDAEHHVQEVIDNVTLRRSTNGGSTWQDVEQVEYGYYDGTTPGGIMGDLASATVETPTGGVISQTDYRYWKSGETANAPAEGAANITPVDHDACSSIARNGSIAFG